MRLAVIACDVLARECYALAATSPHIVDLVLLPQGLHNTPGRLRTRVQAAIDSIEGTAPAPTGDAASDARPRHYDALVLAYALCSNGVVGITARRTPLIVPRGHDCITLLLGSMATYDAYFRSHRGAYWYSGGWIERTLMPGPEREQRAWQHYLEEYDEEDARYLMQAEQGWMREYRWATYINWDLPSADRDRAFTRACAAHLGWEYDEVQGDPSLLRDLLHGVWDEERFLTVRPGECVEPSYDERIMKACAGCECHGAAQTVGR